MSDTMSGAWVAIAIVLPLALGLAAAWPLWGRTSDSLGSILGTFVVFVLGVAFVAREFIHLQQLTYRCIALETVCHFHPLPFTRFFIYGTIAMVQAFVLFAAGVAVEECIRNREFAADWR
jgi:hypothetical protein